MVENFLIVNEQQARILCGCTKEEIEAAKKSNGLLKRIKMNHVNDGTVPLYLKAKIPKK